MLYLLWSSFHLLSENGSLIGNVATTDGTEPGRAFLALQPAFKLAVASPGSGHAPGDAALTADGQHPCALSGSVALKARVEVVGQTDVMLGVFERFIEMQKIYCGHRFTAFFPDCPAGHLPTARSGIVALQ